MTPEQLAADRAVIDAATPGPWLDIQGELPGSDGPWWLVDTRNEDQCDQCRNGANHSIGDCTAKGAVMNCEGFLLREEDAAFIAAARTRWPAALDEIARLRDTLIVILTSEQLTPSGWQLIHDVLK